MAINPVWSALRHAWASLAAHNVRAAVMGGLAVAVWRHPRSTRDVDLLVAADPPAPGDLLRWLQEADFHPKRFPALAQIGEHRFLQLTYSPPGSYLDIPVDFLCADGDFLRGALDRSVPIRVETYGVDARAVSCEDLILLKLSAERLLDRVDVITLLQVNRPTLDLRYLKTWLPRLGLTREWATYWREAFPGEEPPATPASPSPSGTP